jgi:hypothetical protein
MHFEVSRQCSNYDYTLVMTQIMLQEDTNILKDYSASISIVKLRKLQLAEAQKVLARIM